MYRFLSFIILVCSTLFASESDGINEVAPIEMNYMHEFVKMVGSLIIVLFLIFVTVWILRKIYRVRPRATHGKFIRVIEKQYLHPKAAIYFIDVLGKGIVVGESSGYLEMLTDLPETWDLEQRMNQLQENEHSVQPISLWKRFFSR